MRKNLSKKQLGAVGLAAMMAVQTPAMAAEVTTSPEATVQETAQEQQEEVTELQTEEVVESQAEIVEMQDQTVETSLEEESETSAQLEETVEVEASESVKQEESQSEDVQSVEEIEAESSESENTADEYTLTENQEVLTDGWHQDSNGKYTYVKDGQLLKNCVEQIDGSYYGFDENGILYVNSRFYILDPRTTHVVSKCRAKENGRLSVNEWDFEPYFEKKYYYGEDGTAYTGIHTIDGKIYCFDEYYALCQNNFYTRNGEVYYCDADGVATQIMNDAWGKLDDKYYYIKNKAPLKNCIEQINGIYYGFGETGFLYENQEFSLYDNRTRTYIYYRAKEDGSLYISQWYTDSKNNTYYYGEDGKAYSGLHVIDGKQYYFSASGYICKNMVVKAEDGKVYSCDSDGIATEQVNDTWGEVDGKRNYVKDGTFLKNCVEQIDGVYYGFDGSGYLYVNREFYSDSERAYYRAKEDGSLYIGEWYQERYNSYYYGEDGRKYVGFQTINGKQYYFEEHSGWLYKNKLVTDENGKKYYCDLEGVAIELVNNSWLDANGERYYVKDGAFLEQCVEQIDGIYYGFDSRGCLYVNREFFDAKADACYRAKEDGSLYINEWYIDSNDKYYYGEGGKAYRGLQVIDGKQYYFSSNGYVYTNSVITAEDGKKYYCDAEGVATEEEVTNGWKETDGKRYYVKDGKRLENCVEQIDGIYYGFDRNGFLYVNQNFYLDDYETRTTNYYRAKEDGSLYVNEWYTISSSTYYYGEGGKAYTGVHTIDGKQYCFYLSGGLCKNTTWTIDGKVYYCDKEGVATELANNAWSNMDGKYYYVKNGRLLTSCVEQIDGSYYGFDGYGVLYVNQEFPLYDYETQTSIRYKAKEDGRLYVNEWYTIYGSTYYYGKDGKLCTGLSTIDGKQYYFSTSGILCKDGLVKAEDGNSYYCDSEGIATAVTDNSWIQLNEKWYYVRNGAFLKSCVEKIGDNYYGFDENGAMYTNVIFGQGNWSIGSYSYEYYRASASGVLYTNQWYSDYNTAYYYGADARRCKGLQTIDGVSYIFDASGALVVSRMISVDNGNYYCDKNGTVHEMPNNQWYKGDDGDWYYVQDGKALTSCKAQIDGKWYQFDYSGRMDNFDLNTDESGAIRTNSWFYDGTYWYYYDENGETYRSGVYEIQGAKYYFNASSKLVVSKVCTDGTNCYIADENGHLTQITKDGWEQVDGTYYYVENGQLKTDGVYKINGSWYAFADDGSMHANWASNQYRAKADGSLYCSEWYQDSNKKWYYYDENAKSVSGSVTIGKDTYQFDTEGVLYTNSVMYQGVGIDLYKLTDGNGKLVETPGWFYAAGDWYYVLDDGTLYKGILEENGVTYYLGPKMLKNEGFLEVDGVAYQVAENGLVTKIADGFHHGDIENHLYYVSNGKTATAGWLNVDGKWYYFAEKEYAGPYYAVTGTNYTIDGKLYHFNTDGTMASSGWSLYEDGSWYYASASGELATGDVILDGTTYHFDKNGKLQSGVVVENGICKLYSKDGTLLETGNAQEWSLLGGDYYYLRDGVLLKSGAYRLSDGKWYGFDATGKMRANTIADGRFYGGSGAAQTGWFRVAGKWYYASSVNALLQTGLHVINGTEYYFDQNGIMQTGEFVVNGKLFTTDENGVVLSKKTMKNGWTSYEGNSYYYQDGTAYTGFVGDYYVSNGRMVRNEIVEWKNHKYYIGSDGKYLSNTWCNNRRSYATPNGTLVCSEWKQIDGKQYYFGWGGELQPYYLYVSFDEKGVYTKEGEYLLQDNYAQGWLLIGGIYYYKQGSHFISNQTAKINGDWYLFDVHGNMVTGFSKPETIGRNSYTYDDAKYYYGADGKRVNYTGWQVIDGNWYYFNSKSEAVDGWNIINGTKYYFGKTNHFMYTGYKVISGDLYYFNGSGACQGLDNTFTGWHQQDGDWYYIQKGHVTTGTIAVDGRLYGFDSNGVWIAD